jgi:hypothetical protein
MARGILKERRGRCKEHDMPPNGLPFSCRERAIDALERPNDLAREAVGCNGVLAGD